MAENLSVVISADTTSLQAQLALARAEVSAYASDVRNMAAEVRGGDVGQLGNLEQSVAALAGAKAQVSALNSELGVGVRAHQEHKAAVDEHGAALGRLKQVGSEAAGGIKELGATLLTIGGLSGGIKAIAGLFAVEGLVEFVKGTAEAAEKTENLSAALGIAPSKLALLASEFKLAGGDIETATRALLALETKLVEATQNPASKAREAFLAMGISVQEMRLGLTDLPGMLQRLSDAWRAMPEGSERTADFSEIFTRRGLANVVPLLQHNPAELREQVQEALGGNLPTDQGIHRLAEYEQQINKLELAFGGLKKAIVTGFVDPLTDATIATTAWVADSRKAVDSIREMIQTTTSLRNTLGGAAAGAAVGGVVGGVPGAFVGGTAGAIVGFGADAANQSPEEIAKRAVPVPDRIQLRLEGGAEGQLPPTDAEQRLRLPPTDAEQRLLDQIKQRESGGRYDILHDKAQTRIADLGAFPQWEGFQGPAGISHAAGAYGFQPGTYAGIARTTGLTDFSPGSQDANALALLRQQGTKPWPWLASGSSAAAPSDAPAKDSGPGTRIDPALGKQDLERDIKAVTEALKLEEKQLDLDIQKAKGDEGAIQELSQKKIDAARRAAEQEQAIRERYGGAAQERGNKELADQYRNGGTSLQVQELGFEKEKLALQQRYDEQAAVSGIKKLETDRRIDTQEQATELQAVERHRQLGDITASQAADAEVRIVQDHLAAAEKIFADEEAAAGKIKKLADEVANHRKEAEAKAQEDINRIRIKEQFEQDQRGHAIDKELAGSLAQGLVGVASGRQTAGQAVAAFEERQATKALEFVGTKLFDATGIGKVIDGIGEKVSGLFGGTAKAGGEAGLGTAAATAATQVTGFGAALTSVTAQLTGHSAAVGANTVATGTNTATTATDTTTTGLSATATGIHTASVATNTTAFAADTTAVGTNAAAQAGEAAAGGIGGLIKGIPIVGSLLGLFFEQGGVVPSAEGGMVNDGRGGRLSVLHPQEMVLPRDLSLGVQDMIRRGNGGWTIARQAGFSLPAGASAAATSAGSAGSGPVQISVSAIDSQDVRRFFANYPHLIADAVAKSQRNFRAAR